MKLFLVNLRGPKLLKPIMLCGGSSAIFCVNFQYWKGWRAEGLLHTELHCVSPEKRQPSPFQIRSASCGSVFFPYLCILDG